MTHEERMRANDEWTGLIRDSLARESTPEAWLGDALAIPRTHPAPAASWHEGASWRDRADVLVPSIAGGMLVSGLAVALIVARGPLTGWLPPVPHAADLLGALQPSALRSGGDLLRLALFAGVLPLAGVLALADSVRGFPLLRRWFA